MVQCIDDAMAEALSHLNRVSTHFHKYGQHGPANDIGKLSIMIINSFTEGIEMIPSDAYLMDDMSEASENNNVRKSVMQNSIHRQAFAALMNELEKGQDDGFARRVDGGNNNRAFDGTWAQVAGIQESHSHASNAIKMAQSMSTTPQMSLPTSSRSHSTDRNELMLHASERLSNKENVPPFFQEFLGEVKIGIIRVLGKVGKDFIQFVTTRIHEGPLYELKIESAYSARVTFQQASQAMAFLKSHEDMEKILGFGRFGPGYRIELAELADWNEDHRRMNQPIRERRRLSFARKRLFSEGMSPDKWKQDVRALAGPGNIDFLWVFNSGNATAVFTSTKVARRVLEAFDKWTSVRHNAYSGVSVTYSSDPCEKELVLVREAVRPVMMKSYNNRKPIR